MEDDINYPLELQDLSDPEDLEDENIIEPEEDADETEEDAFEEDF